ESGRDPGWLERAHRRGAARSHAEATCRCAVLLAWQARRTHRTLGLSACGDAVLASSVSGSIVVTASVLRVEQGIAGPEAEVWRVLENVPDPEIPALSIVDLGIVRYVRTERGRVRVGLTPTYSGCPATEVIRRSVQHALEDAGHESAVIDTVLSPPWTSD